MYWMFLCAQAQYTEWRSSTSFLDCVACWAVSASSAAVHRFSASAASVSTATSSSAVSGLTNASTSMAIQFRMLLDHFLLTVYSLLIIIILIVSHVL